MWKKPTAPLDGSPFSTPASLLEYVPPLPQQPDDEDAGATRGRLREITAAVQDELAAVLHGTSLLPNGRAHSSAVLEARDLCKSFGREPALTPILKNIDLQIIPG